MEVQEFFCKYDLTTPFDVSTCTFVSEVDVDTDALTKWN